MAGVEGAGGGRRGGGDARAPMEARRLGSRGGAGDAAAVGEMWRHSEGGAGTAATHRREGTRARQANVGTWEHPGKVRAAVGGREDGV